MVHRREKKEEGAVVARARQVTVGHQKEKKMTVVEEVGEKGAVGLSGMALEASAG